MIMVRWPATAVAVLGVAGAVALALPGSAAAVTWQLTPAQAQVVPDSATDAWGQPVSGGRYCHCSDVWHLSGTTWTTVAMPTGQAWAAVGADSPTDVWAVGNGMTHYNGSSWTTYTLADAGITESMVLSSVAILSPTDVWAAGPNHTDPTGLPLVHWDGTQWSRVTPPAPAGATWVSVNALSASAGDLWALASASVNCSNSTCETEYFAARWDGTGWSLTPALPAGFTAGTNISADSPTDVWVVGGGAGDAAHYNGSTWSTFAMPATSGQTDLGLHEIAARGGQAWAVGSTHESSNNSTHAAVYHWDGLTWSSVGFPVTSDNSNTSTVTYLPGSTTVWIEAHDPSLTYPGLLIAAGG
jgi:hypothetical protein